MSPQIMIKAGLFALNVYCICLCVAEKGGAKMKKQK